MRLLISLVFFWTLANVALAGCADNRISLRGTWGEAVFTVEVAADEASRAKGLMYRKELPQFSGMLFVFDRPQHARFWMKNTLIPLDMLFLDKKGVVQKIMRMATPGDLSIIDGGTGILEVLEVNGGTVESLGIVPGSEARHPSLGANAAWACE